MSSPKLPPEILAALRMPAAEPVESQSGDEPSEVASADGSAERDDSDTDAATGFTNAVSYEEWHGEQTWSVRAPP